MNSINFTIPSGVTHSTYTTILESLCTNYSLWKISFPDVDLSAHVTNSGEAFIGDISLDTYRLKSVNTSGITHTSDRVILKSPYT